MAEEYKQTFTLTFGDVAENHARMKKHGVMADKGYDKQDLVTIRTWFRNKGATTRLVKLHNYLPADIPQEVKDNNKAYVLIIKKGVNVILDSDTGANDLYNEQNALMKDTKALMYGRVVNKHARHNLCFDNIGIAPNYEEGQGTVVAFDSVPITKRIRETLGTILDNMKDLMLEGNYYYDVKSCGIGWHSDLERTKVIGLRLGSTMPLYFNWFHKNKPIGTTVRIDFNHGDMYVMSEKAVAPDGRHSNSYTLRHSAGADKYTKL